MTTAREALRVAEERLRTAGVPSARADAEVLLSWATGLPRGGLHRLDGLSDDAAAVFRTAVARREQREPLQHITGRAAFRSLDLEVGPGVFVPRPETEVLAGVAVAELLRLLEARPGGFPAADPLAVDLCAGSGAVALAMATEAPGCRVVAVELSSQAAEYAERNAAPYAAQTPVEVRCGDIADAVNDLAGQADVVTANPPYIPFGAFESVAVEARQFDPPLALWSGDDGLQMIRKVAGVAARLLRPGGLVLCEHADAQGDSAPGLFAGTGQWVDVRDCCDLARRPRFVSARKAPTTELGLAR